MVKPGPKPKPDALTERVQFRISASTLAVYEDFASVVDVPVNHVLRQVIEGSTQNLIALAAAFRQIKGGDTVKGLELYRQVLASVGPQLEMQQGVSDQWLDQAKAHQAVRDGELGEGAAASDAAADAPDASAALSRSLERDLK